MKGLRKWSSQSTSNKIFDIVNFIILFLVFALCLYPLYYIVIASMSESVVGAYLLPNGFNIEGYKMVFAEKEVWTGYANTIFYTVVGTVCSLLITLPCAYALSRKDFVGRGWITGFIMVTMFISGGLIPGYLNMYNLGLVGTRAAIIFSGMTSAYNLIVSRTFFASTIPGELLEAAKMDGCGNGKFFVKIVMPLSKPIVAVMALYFGVARWNSYFTEMIYLRDIEKYPLSLILRRLLFSVQAMEDMLSEGLIEAGDAVAKMELSTVMQYCLIIVSTLPMLIIYPFLQKYFEKGIMIGSVKG